MDYDYLYELPWFTIFIYTSAIVAFLVALYLEHKDLFCPDGNKCYNGNGAAYIKGKVNDNDSYKKILQKIRISSRYDEASVYWRRSIVFTVLLLFVLLVLIKQDLPTAYEVLISFIVIYLFIFLMLTYYQNTVSIYATKQVDEGTKILERYIN